MSYLVECVAGPSRHAGHAIRQLRTPLTPSFIARPRVSRPLRARIALNLPAKRFQSTSAASPIVFDTVSTAAETSMLDPLANLLLASPLPAWATIIALTLCVRTGITLPVTLWQRRRMLREAQEVRPRMKEINEKLAVVVARESRDKGLGYEEYKKNLKARLATEQSALHKRFGTHPIITMGAPLAVHVPVLITVSLTLRRALELPGSTMASEGFWWLDTLGEVDPIGALPILGAMIALTNAETLGRRREQAMEAVAERKATRASVQLRKKPTPIPQSARPVQAVKTIPAEPARYEAPPSVGRSAGQTRRLSTTTIDLATHRPIIKTSAKSTARKTLDEIPASDEAGGKLTETEKANVRSMFLTYVLRGMALVFIPFASSVPAALAMYWVTSLSYTLGQTLVLNRIDSQAALARKTASASA